MKFFRQVNASLAIAIFLSSFGQASFAQYKVDTRQIVSLSVEERAWLMNEMRGHLAGIEKTISGLSQGDIDAVREAAIDRGTPHLNDPTRMKFPHKVPDAWKALAGNMHKGFDSVLVSVNNKDSVKETLTRVSNLTQNCIACHAAYRIVEER
jgi:cytochrome c556